MHLHKGLQPIPFLIPGTLIYNLLTLTYSHLFTFLLCLNNLKISSSGFDHSFFLILMANLRHPSVRSLAIFIALAPLIVLYLYQVINWSWYANFRYNLPFIIPLTILFTARAGGESQSHVIKYYGNWIYEYINSDSPCCVIVCPMTTSTSSRY